MESPLPTVNRARGGTKRSVPLAEAKRKVIDSIKAGLSVKEAMAAVERAELTYNDWRKNDKEFAAAVDSVREVARAARTRGEGGKVEVPDFPEFCSEYLNKP